MGSMSSEHRQVRVLSSRWFFLRVMMFSLAGAAMIGQAGRMIYQGVFCPASVYAPNTVDLWFDWATLGALGIGVLAYTFYSMFHRRQPS